MKTVDENTELFDQAYKAYTAHCEKTGAAVEYPSKDASEIGTKYIYLRNSYRLLATYDIHKKTIVQPK